MCGIFFTISHHGHAEPSDETLSNLRARGPDSLVVHRDTLQNTNAKFSSFYLTFASSVLSLRGDRICAQPLIDPETGSVLCWNGEAWKMNGSQVPGNDSQVVFQTLLSALSASPVKDNSDLDKARSQSVLNVLTSIAGPYAFVFYDATAATIYYGRDRLGRRSLNTNWAQSPGSAESDIFVLSSVSTDHERSMVEVNTTGIHYLRLHDANLISRTVSWSGGDCTINNSIPEHIIDTLPSTDAITALDTQMIESLRLRVVNIPTYNITQSSQKAPSKLAILFSGGLDCTLLARLSHDILPTDQPIDLLNVAFENPRTVRAAAATAKKENVPLLSPYETCPDRMTGRSSYVELLKVCPDRDWRFVAIDIPYAEVLSHRPIIINLIKPHNTEMDLSIAMALYFAARGSGTVAIAGDDLSQSVTYKTPARVLLSGLGADELFGGYARHAAAFSRGGWQSLNEELELDFTRIGSRNLGRDDRVMSHWAREVRYPFLDEDFVKFALGLPAWEKCGFRFGKEIPKHFEITEKYSATGPEDLEPAKLLLRCLMWKKNMTGVATETKRAIQFGARTAKMEGGRTKGTDLLV